MNFAFLKDLKYIVICSHLFIKVVTFINTIIYNLISGIADNFILRAPIGASTLSFMKRLTEYI